MAGYPFPSESVRLPLFTCRLSADESCGRTVLGMSDRTPDPFLAQTGNDEEAGDLDDDFDFELDDADDALDVEEKRVRGR